MTLIKWDDYLVTGPTVEPLDLEEVKKHLRFTSTSEDTLLDVWISMARQYFETRTGLQLMTATWARTVDAMPTSGLVELPKRPLQSVVSIASDDGSPASVLDASSYRVVIPSGTVPAPGWVDLQGGWTGTRGRIEYLAGFGDAPGAVPELIRGALLVLVGYFHKYRAEAHDVTTKVAEIPLGAELIMRQYRYAGRTQVPPMRTL